MGVQLCWNLYDAPSKDLKASGPLTLVQLLT